MKPIKLTNEQRNLLSLLRAKTKNGRNEWRLRAWSKDCDGEVTAFFLGKDVGTTGEYAEKYPKATVFALIHAGKLRLKWISYKTGIVEVVEDDNGI